MERDYYQILGVTRAAPEREIKRAYHKLARQLHPDKASSPEEIKRCEEEFALISQIYNTLKDPQKRAAYDKTLAAEAQVKAAEVGVTEERKPTEAGGDPSQRLLIAQKAYVRGMQFYKLGEYPRAIQFFEAAIRTYDKEPVYYSKLAGALLKTRRRFTRAVEACRKAIEMDPYNADYRLTLAEIFEAAGSLSLARKMYEEVLKWDAANETAKARLLEMDKAEGSGSILHRLRRLFRK